MLFVAGYWGLLLVLCSPIMGAIYTSSMSLQPAAHTKPNNYYSLFFTLPLISNLHDLLKVALEL